MKLEILYEDNHLIAVVKPAGMLVQGDQWGERCLMDEVKEYIKERYQKPGNVFLGLLHRLDRPVSGIVLFSKTSKGASRLSEQLRTRSLQKIYYALVEGIPSLSSGTLVGYISKDEVKNKVTVSHDERPGFLYVELSYEVMTSIHNYTLLKVVPRTGRPHQIRAQLATMGNPIAGDVKYGAHTSLPDRSIALHASSLSFMTATTKEHKELQIPLPSSWYAFFPQLAALDGAW